MSHHQPKGVYPALASRINRFPQGAPPSDLLYRILSLLFNEEEAALVALLPLRPFTAAKAARLWKVTEVNAWLVLDTLAERAMLLDVEKEGTVYYVLPPPMAGFFEFSLMRVRSDLDQQALSRLLHQYVNVEDAFVRDLFAGGETQLGRVLVSEPSLADDNAAVVLDYERASEIISTASHLAVGLCYCRHKMGHLGRACRAPLGDCMTLNDVAESLIRHGTARRIDVAEGLDLLQEAWSLNLLQCADNVQQGVNFICNCCSCCCEGLIAVRRLAVSHPLCTTNFLPAVDAHSCSGCGRCADICPIGAMSVVSKHEVDGVPRASGVVNGDICLGCGICVRSCSATAIKLVPRSRRVVTPVNTAHRIVLMAIERGKLQQLIFDTQALFSHRLMAAILGVVLRLPGVKQLMASRQMKSRYLERLLAGRNII
ncbi:4Fe-4S dicluster domain-containing protein [Geotalea toluenoxydans]|uniref:4Fe-4S dicluster domain-containing protein n=1 Tax=Geotalea toluenoxydans TaxID=421624 RepID=UPI0006D1302B|nr:4Fe-4S dicluster domain-containing protein [Geotalea toluenoxydans]